MINRFKRPTPDDEFKQCFDILQRIGENTRSTVYAFVIIHGALLVWALNAIVWPVEVMRVDEALKKQAEMIPCLIILESNNNAPENQGFQNKCLNVLESNSLEFRIKNDNFLKKSLQDDSHKNKNGTDVSQKEKNSLDVPQIDIQRLEHELQYRLDKSAEIARFSVPIIGITSNREWLWLVCIALGPLFYYLIRDSFANLSYLLDYIKKISINKPVRLMLLSTVQIVSSSTQKITLQGEVVPSGGLSSTSKLIVMWLMFSLPILLSSLIIYDWCHYVFYSHYIKCPLSDVDYPGKIVRFICQNHIMAKYTSYFIEPGFVGGFISIPIFIFEIVLFLQICRLLLRLSRVHQEIRNSASGSGTPPTMMRP